MSSGWAAEAAAVFAKDWRAERRARHAVATLVLEQLRSGSHDPRALFREVRIGKTGRLAGARLDQYLVSGLYERRQGEGHQGYASLAGVGFFGNADSHRPNILPSCPVRQERAVMDL